MGTTESIFYDEEEPDNDQTPAPTPQPQKLPQLRKPPAPKRDSARRQRPPPPIQRIRGLVLGGPNCGKRTLLARLQGSDPFAPATQRGPQLGSTASIPYLPPNQNKCWDRILLQVQAARQAPQQKSDFAILLVRPQHDFEKTREYLIKTVSTILSQLGYHDQQDEKQEKDSDLQKGAEARMNPQTQEPVCLCILFNFRDETQLQPRQQEELQHLIEKLTYDNYKVPTQKVVLQCAETSLRNCYGLNTLHNFIYKTYLQRKQTDLQLELNQVQAQIGTTEDLPPVLDYRDFVKVLEPEDTGQKPPSKSTTVPTTIQDLQEEALRASSPVAQSPQAAIPPRRGQPAPRRTFVTKKHQKSTSPRIGKEALEAFLASSSDEEDEPKQKSKPLSKYNNSDDEDDDDDFFYDEGGNRRFNHNTLRNHTFATGDAESVSSSDGSARSEHSTKKHEAEPNPVPTPTHSSPASEEAKFSSTSVTNGSSKKVPLGEANSSRRSPNDPSISGPKDKSIAMPVQVAAVQPTPDNKTTGEGVKPEVRGKTQGSNQDQSLENSPTSSAAGMMSSVDQSLPETRNAKDGWSDEDDDYMIEDIPEEEGDDDDEPDETEATRELSSKPAMPVTSSDAEKTKIKAVDDEEFSVEEGGTALISSADSAYDSWDDDEPSPAPASTVAPSSPNGISAAALAAIAAAQTEAEAMLMQNQEASMKAVSEEDKKKKKKKKHKKKKHKE